MNGKEEGNGVPPASEPLAERMNALKERLSSRGQASTDQEGGAGHGEHRPGESSSSRNAAERSLGSRIDAQPSHSERWCSGGRHERDREDRSTAHEGGYDRRRNYDNRAYGADSDQYGRAERRSPTPSPQRRSRTPPQRRSQTPPFRRGSPSYGPVANGDVSESSWPAPRHPGAPPARPPAMHEHRGGYQDRYPPPNRHESTRPPHMPENGAPGEFGGGWGRRGGGAPNAGPPGDYGGGWAQRRDDGEGGGRRPDFAADAGGSFLAARQAQRDALAERVTIWPPSPREPYLDSDEERELRRKEKERRREKERSSKHRSSHSHRSSRDKERDRDERKRSSNRHRSRDRHSSKHHSSSRHSSSKHKRHSSDEESDGDRSVRARSHDHDHERKHHRSSRSRRDSRDDDSDRDDRRHSSSKRHRRRRSSASSARSASESDDDSRSRALVLDNGKGPAAPAADEDSGDEEIGPQLPKTEDGKPIDPRSFGGALLPGEGSAMAAFVAEGKRIPRRGEIGLQADQIEAYERAGFVMSGSRHKRMNAVRMRKENQVISAEEKRGILKLQKEEKMKKEAQIVSQFKEMVDTMQPPGR